MKIGIIGTGGVGGYFGARLADAGHELTFIARGEHLEAIRRDGLKVKSIKGDLHIHPENVSDDLSVLSHSELILLGVKAWQVKDIAGEISKYLNENALVIPLQNGVLAVEELAACISPSRVLGGLCMIFSCVESPGIINHSGFEPAIVFGETDKTIKERTKRIQQVLDVPGIKSVMTEDIDAALWRKFLLICLSSLNAICDAGYGLLREVPETRQLMVDIMTEVFRLARAKGINLEENIVEKSLKAVDGYPYDARSSLSRDVLSGKPSEIEYQNGTVVKLGEQMGIETPANRFVHALVKLLENKP